MGKGEGEMVEFIVYLYLEIIGKVKYFIFMMAVRVIFIISKYVLSKYKD